MTPSLLALSALVALAPGGRALITDASPLLDKAHYLQQDIVDKHLGDGLYVSIVPAAPHGAKLTHTVNEPGNVIHAGVWTGRYLAGVGYQYAVTHDPWARKHGGEILRGLRKLQEVTGKPGLLARGFVRGHGPVEGWERFGADSKEWHQGQGAYADYRWYGDVSVDNFNAALYGYAVYFDLAADAAQKKIIARDVDRLMTHLLDNHCRIVDVDGEVTEWGHVGIDPDPSRDAYYRKQYASMLARYGMSEAEWRPPLRSSLMLLPDLLIASHITGKPRYMDTYRAVVARFRDNPDRMVDRRPFSLQRVARVNHSSEGQAYEALYNLVRYENDPKLLALYGTWVRDLWDMNWMEGNSLFAYMTEAMARKISTSQPVGSAELALPHMEEGLSLAADTLRLYPVDRVLRPVMNSIKPGLELNPYTSRADEKQAAKPVPINERPLDNEYEWKGSPYRIDGWLKPAVTGFQVSCDDPLVAWFCDDRGSVWQTLDGWKTWRNMSAGLMGAHVRRIAASPKRTFVLWAETDRGVLVTRDGGLSWRAAGDGEAGPFASGAQVPAAAELTGWRIPIATYAFDTPRGLLAGGPGGCYLRERGGAWSELHLWPEEETGPADFVHAYWMGRYYGLL